MKTLSKMTLLAALSGVALTASAQVFTFNIDPSQQSIPDANANGVTFVGTVSGVDTSGQPLRVSAVDINLQGNPIANNGDYYMTLVQENTGLKAVLLNRVGKPENSGAGYADNGFNIRLSDDSPNDVHAYQNVLGHQYQSPLTGTWQPDGRNVDPNTVTFDRSGGLRTLAVFYGQNPNGNWDLFVADLASGGLGKLVSWGLEIAPVPEPHQYALVAGIALIAFGIYRRYALKAA